MALLPSERHWHNRRTTRMLESLEQQPDLRKHVRVISFKKIPLDKATSRKIVETIELCQATRTLSLHLDWSPDVWPIIHAARMLPLLEVLQLSGPHGGPCLHMILEHFNLPTLRDLRLSRYGIGRDGMPGVSYYRPIESFSQDKLDKFSVVAHSTSSAITSLRLSDPSSPADFTRILVGWPSKLVRLSLARCADFTRNTLERILGVHRDSLQHITVGFLPGCIGHHDKDGYSGILDFSKFPHLNELCLSAHNIFAEKPSQAVAKLATPGLRHLTIDFDLVQDRSSFRAFSADQVLWMAEFASEKANENSKIKLQSIFINFNIYCDPWELEGNATTPWPWEYLQQAKKDCLRHDLLMRYSKPDITKEEWAERMGRNFLQT